MARPEQDWRLAGLGLTSGYHSAMARSRQALDYPDYLSPKPPIHHRPNVIKASFDRSIKRQFDHKKADLQKVMILPHTSRLFAPVNVNSDS